MELQGNFFAIWGAVYLLAVTAQSSTTLIGYEYEFMVI